MNDLSIRTRIDLLAIAVSQMADVVDLLLEHLPPAGREGPDFADINEDLAHIRDQAERCMEV